jgi:hypothetical protein
MVSRAARLCGAMHMAVGQYYHVYRTPGEDRETALARVGANARELQKAVEMLQSQRAAGLAFRGENARVAALHEKELAAYALQLP